MGKKNDDHSFKITEISNAKNRHFWVIFGSFLGAFWTPHFTQNPTSYPPFSGFKGDPGRRETTRGVIHPRFLEQSARDGSAPWGIRA